MALLLPISLLSLLSSTYAFKVDGSCTGTDADLIRDASVQAFDMASKAQDALNVSPRDSNVDRLIGLLFCAEGEDATTYDVGPLRDSFSGILAMSAENENADSDNNNREVVLYCSMDRVEQNDRGEWVETGTNQIISDPDDDHKLAECRDTFDATLAFTWNPKTTYGRVEGDDGSITYPRSDHAAQVTICPWFLQWSHNKKYRTWKDVSTKARLAKWMMPLLTYVWPFAPIDAVNLLDKVLLHEFTHTVAGGQTDDVALEGATMGVAYGWKSAKELALKGNTEENTRPFENADTLALFGSGVRLLNEDPVKYIDDRGYVKTENPLARRSIPPAFRYRSTPAAFEGFVTMVREARAVATPHRH